MFIVFEGVNAVGKTTQVDKLVNWYRKCGAIVKRIKFPSNADCVTMKDFLDDFKAHQTSIIRGITAGMTVIADRYYDSTKIYQEDPEAVDRYIEKHKLRKPDIVIVLTAPAVICVARNQLRRSFPQKLELLNTVNEQLIGYRQLALQQPNYFVISADRTPQAIHKHIKSVLRSYNVYRLSAR